jgi:hypothetical protein
MEELLREISGRLPRQCHIWRSRCGVKMIAARDFRRRNSQKNLVPPSAIGRLVRPATFLSYFEAAIARKVSWRQRAFFYCDFRAAFLTHRTSDLPVACPQGRDGEGRFGPRHGLTDACQGAIQTVASPQSASTMLMRRGRNVTVRLWWGGTPIPVCRAALVARPSPLRKAPP